MTRLSNILSNLEKVKIRISRNSHSPLYPHKHASCEAHGHGGDSNVVRLVGCINRVLLRKQTTGQNKGMQMRMWREDLTNAQYQSSIQRTRRTCVLLIPSDNIHKRRYIKPGMNRH